MPLSKKHIIPISIFAFSLILRIALISKGPYHGDTIALIIQAEKTIETLQLHKQSALGFPLIVILASIFITVFKIFSWGTTALAVNSISVLFSSFAVLAFYFLCIELFEHFRNPKDETFFKTQRLTAIIGSLLLSISPIFLGISVYGKNHAPCMFFLILATYFLLQYLRTKQTKKYIASILLFGLMGATRLDILVLATPLSFAFFTLSWPPADEKNPLSLLVSTIFKFLVWWISIFACILLFYLPYFFQESLQAFIDPINNYYTLYLKNNYLGIFSYKLFKTFNYLVHNFTYAGLMIALLGLIGLFKRSWKIMIFLLLWIGFPFFQYGNLLTTMTSRYFVILLPPLIFSMAFAFATALNKRNFYKINALILLFAISVITFLRIYPVLKIRHENDDVPAFARWFKQAAEPGAHMIHADGSVFFKYYADVPVQGRPLSADIITEKKLNEFRSHINQLIRRGIPIYINDASLYSYNAENSFSNFVFQNYHLKYLGSHYYEDWHGGAMQSQRMHLKVYKLQIKEKPDYES